MTHTVSLLGVFCEFATHIVSLLWAICEITPMSSQCSGSSELTVWIANSWKAHSVSSSCEFPVSWVSSNEPTVRLFGSALYEYIVSSHLHCEVNMICYTIIQWLYLSMEQLLVEASVSPLPAWAEWAVEVVPLIGNRGSTFCGTVAP